MDYSFLFVCLGSWDIHHYFCEGKGKYLIIAISDEPAFKTMKIYLSYE
ncbi:MAG: hypothetical protein ACFCUM_16215 [Bacteroidales bacterium]